jgi:hypothetical protein
MFLVRQENLASPPFFSTATIKENMSSPTTTTATEFSKFPGFTTIQSESHRFQTDGRGLQASEPSSDDSPS